MMEQQPDHYMKLALQEARKAFDRDEVPVGAVIVQGGQIIGRGSNQVELLRDVTAHAEIIALTAACQHLGSKYLPEATLYVTLEPCLMCAGALQWSQIGRVVYGASDDKKGFHTCCTTSPFHPKTQIEQGLLSEDCASLLRSFFRQKRGK